MKSLFKIRILNLDTDEVLIWETKRCIDPYPTLARLLNKTQWKRVEWEIINITATAEVLI